uniref:Uncharacterized protein YBL113C-like n=1 Tax=Phallusia mammillata TaxID=59560 RepID=A0A6F9DU37_9ASCI|nr:uncharacterized protein YBL113C-like [Phallusia mammillata]
MEFIRLFIAICTFAGFMSMSDAFCSCTYHHPQTKFCNSRFIGKIRVTDGSIVESVENSSAIIAGKARILTVYKGKYEDFEEGETIYLHTPATFGTCRREFEVGDQLVTGRPFQGGLFIDQCDFQEMEEFFSVDQFRAIRSHIRTRAYVRGCQDCFIKDQYDGSYIYENECRSKYEFPVSTSACVPTGINGRCQWVKFSKRMYKIPDEEAPSPITPSMVPSTTTTKLTTTSTSSPPTTKATTTVVSRQLTPVRDSIIQNSFERSLETEEEENSEETTENEEKDPISSPKAAVVGKQNFNVDIGTVAYHFVTVKPPKFSIVKYLMKVVWPRHRRR